MKLFHIQIIQSHLPHALVQKCATGLKIDFPKASVIKSLLLNSSGMKETGAKGVVAKGFTLTELMTTISIAAILLTVGIPTFARINDTSLMRQQIQSAQMIVATARSQAIIQRAFVTVCALNDNNECHRDWQNTITAFQDANNNQLLESEDRILYSVAPVDNSKIVRQFNRDFIRFRPSGDAFATNGTMKICLNSDQPIVKTLILSGTGRIRRGQDSNGDGIDENSSGNNTDCGV